MSPSNGGAERVRTDDLLNANQPLFQLSYGPFSFQRVPVSSTLRFRFSLKELSSSF